ncbi:alpha/beta-hydrolase [Trichoderma citrinoviride]|uniref:Alpha/beta-hydrolase n=1 Tax=Trichoderma citrinoviride TaxID=58853 RepID=A0A2T4B333_9HYPO|nr:alpha/beta-hydrolase [Trichoderma citrinoviride]PTB63737.1 alpha/beta-hydrolase [Trichoderma citrinoviride]
MIDHVLGRPSSKSRRLQVLAVLSFWTFYLYKGHKHGPPVAQKISKFLSRKLTAWQTVVITMLYLYAARNFSALVGLASPEPMANMYDPTYYRATWVLTALDAGFWTAMKIRSKWLRDLASIVFSLYYLVAAERADEKVRKVRGMITVEHLRVAWNKGTTPYLGFLQRLMRPRFTRWPPRQVRIPRPANSDYKEAVSAWLYYDGPLADLAHHSRVVLDIPGGGFVAMDPRCNDDKLFAWASKTGLPILSVDYKKAPEYPYPYALNECFDVYVTLVRSRGRCIGMSGRETPRIVVTGDSAGGNLAVAATLMVLETGISHFRSAAGVGKLPPPDGLVCFYPTLDMNIGNWMTDEQMSLIRDRRSRKTNKSIVKRKSMQYNDLVGTPHHSDNEDETTPPPATKQPAVDNTPSTTGGTRPEYCHAGPRALSTSSQSPGEKKDGAVSHRAEPMKTRLATSSMISYFNDRVLTPEMMRAMIILYIGAHNRPDFTQDYFLSPVLAPEELLENFPKTYFMTGERDPLVDDTVIFAGRLRRAKEAAARRQMMMSSSSSRADLDDNWTFDDKEVTEVLLIPGTSHGFMQFPGVYPPAWKHFERSAAWFDQLFVDAEAARAEQARRAAAAAAAASRNQTTTRDGFRRQSIAESSGDEDRPLEISMTKMSRGRTLSQQNGDANGHGEETTSSTSPPVDGNGGNGNGANGHVNGERNGAAGKKTKKGIRGNKSLVKLTSSDDLLGRRMHGLASGLTSTGDEELYM